MEIKIIQEFKFENGIKQISKENGTILIDNIYFNYLKILRTNQEIKLRGKIKKEENKGMYETEFLEITEIKNITDNIEWNVVKSEGNKLIVSSNIKIEKSEELEKLNQEQIKQFFSKYFLLFAKQSHLNDSEIWKEKLHDNDSPVAYNNIKILIDYHLSSLAILNSCKITNLEII